MAGKILVVATPIGNLDDLSPRARLLAHLGIKKPLLSDPGFLLVREAAAAGVRIEPIPGPAAPLAALVASGLPPYPFTFADFPPPKTGKRRSFYKGWADLGHTLVLFESPTASSPAWKTPWPSSATAPPPWPAS